MKFIGGSKKQGRLLNCRCYIIFIFLNILLVFCGAKIAIAETIGMSPSVVKIPAIINNSEIYKKTTISIPQAATEDIRYEVRFRGDYPEFIKGADEVVLPAGKNSVDYVFSIAPVQAANDSYESYIDFMRQPKDTGEQQSDTTTVSIIAGITLTVKYTVSDEQILEYKIDSLDIYDSEIGQPLTIEYYVNNTGNVQWQPNQIELKITDENDETNKSTIVIDKNIPITKPGSGEKYQIAIDHQLIQGKYSAKGIFTYQGAPVAELSSQTFQIFAAGTLEQKGEFINLVSNKKQYFPGEKIKVEANFRNTSDIALKGILVTELYTADNSLVDLRRSPEVEITRQAENAFIEYFQLDDIGIYKISSYIEYGNKKTEAKTVDIEIIKQKGFIDADIIAYSVLGLVTIIIFTLVFLFKRRKNKNNKKK